MNCRTGLAITHYSGCMTWRVEEIVAGNLSGRSGFFDSGPR